MPLDVGVWSTWIYDLYRLGQSHATAGNIQEIYQHILTHIVSGFHGKSGSLALRNKSGDHLTIVAGIDLPADVIGSRVPLDQGVLGRVVTDEHPLLMAGDISKDHRFKKVSRKSGRRALNSSICWPLKVEGKVVGAVSVNGFDGGKPFDEADVKQGEMLLNLAGLVLHNVHLRMEQQRRIQELKESNNRLAAAQSQLLQSEKMASIGQLAAGVAHEINNPIGYVYSNLGTLEKYLTELFGLLEAYEGHEGGAGGEELKALRERVDLEYLKEDVPALMKESKEGITRVKKIVQDLKDFSHADTSEEWVWSDLRQGVESTLNIVWNELKYKVEVKRDYGELPEVECLPSQLNQVFMNLLVNAGQAIEERGEIRIGTGVEGDQVWVEIADTGKGIEEKNLKKIFDPFFTTKPVGKGTGLGLSLSYGIVQKHHGRIEVESEVGVGTRFRIWLPIQQPREDV